MSYTCQNCGARLDETDDHYDYRDNRYSCAPPDRNSDPLHDSAKLEHAGKTFFLDHKSNRRGHYVKLTEAKQGRRETILLPIEVVVAAARFLARAAQRAGLPISPPST